MSDAGRPDQGDGQQEPVGSVGEEAAKLFGALSDWARQQEAPDAAQESRTDPEAGPGAHEAWVRGLRGVGEHVADGGQDCRWCPVCQVIHVVRHTSPEVRAHLATAAGSLMQAAAGLLATHAPGSTDPDAPRGGVEHIDLDGDPDSDGDPDGDPDGDQTQREHRDDLP